MSKLPLILTLKVPANVDRSEFEPDAVWGPTEVATEVYVLQFVRKMGSSLVGATETYTESLVDVVGDSDRFVMLAVDANFRD